MMANHIHLRWTHGALNDNIQGGRPRTAINLLLLLGEMEGVYQHLKYMGFIDDMNTIDQMKQRYYKLYFQKVKEEKHNVSTNN